MYGNILFCREQQCINYYVHDPPQSLRVTSLRKKLGTHAWNYGALDLKIISHSIIELLNTHFTSKSKCKLS